MFKGLSDLQLGYKKVNMNHLDSDDTSSFGFGSGARDTSLITSWEMRQLLLKCTIMTDQLNDHHSIVDTIEPKLWGSWHFRANFQHMMLANSTFKLRDLWGVQSSTLAISEHLRATVQRDLTVFSGVSTSLPKRCSADQPCKTNHLIPFSMVESKYVWGHQIASFATWYIKENKLRI